MCTGAAGEDTNRLAVKAPWNLSGEGTQQGSSPPQSDGGGDPEQQALRATETADDTFRRRISMDVSHLDSQVWLLVYQLLRTAV